MVNYFDQLLKLSLNLSVMHFGCFKLQVEPGNLGCFLPLASEQLSVLLQYFFNVFFHPL